MLHHALSVEHACDGCAEVACHLDDDDADERCGEDSLIEEP